MLRRAVPLLALAVAAAVAVSGASAGGPPVKGTFSTGLVRDANLEYVPGEVVVRFRAGVSGAAQRSTLAARGAEVSEALGLARTKVVELPDGVSVEEGVRMLERDPDVLFAEPNYLYTLSAVPNDPLFPQLWGLDQPSDKDIDAPEAWNTTKGSPNVVVAVIDSGIEYVHPDLAPNIWINKGDPPGGGDQDKNGFPNDTRGWDFVQNDNTPRDPNGHGTHVAGTIGARGNNGLGMTGVNWQVKLMPVRAADAMGSLTNSAITNSITYACKNGARIVNGSFGGPSESAATKTAINSPACAKTLFAFAAGNAGANNDVSPSFPCNTASARIICVAATDQNDARASFSNYGVTNVDLAAPGVDILSAAPSFSAVRTDGFEDTPTLFTSRWGGAPLPGQTIWGTSTTAFSGLLSMADSPGGNYPNNADIIIRSLAPFSLSGRTGCLVDYRLRLATEQGFDFFSTYAGTVFDGSYANIMGGAVSGSTGGVFIPWTDDLGDFDGRANVHLLYRLTSDSSNVADGAYVDDLAVKCLATPASPGEYQELDGTSMATPHVAGVAALLLARNPTLTVAQLRNIILSSVDAVAGLAGVVATGGRLNAANALAMTPPPPKCRVPKLIGKTLAGAKTALAARHCTLGAVKKAFSAKVKKNRVMKQTIQAGASRPYGTKVGVTLSKGKRR